MSFIILIILLDNSFELSVELIDFLIDILDVFTVSLVLPLFILLLVSLLILGTKFIVDFRLFFTLLLEQHFLDARDQAGDRVFIS